MEQKLTGWQLKQRFNKEYLEQHPFYRINYDHLIVKLSKLFDLVRTRGHPVEGDASAGGSQNAFVRSTTKYWVSPLVCHPGPSDPGRSTTRTSSR
jgi:SPX domain protein involved in polyphosphate accumulation